MTTIEPLAIEPGPDLYDQLDALRGRGPAPRVRIPLGGPGGLEVRAVADPEVIRFLTTHPAMSKSPENWVAYREGRVPPLHPQHFITSLSSMLTTDGPAHARLRGLVSQAFTPGNVETVMRPLVERVTGELLNALAALPPGEEIDLRAAFAYELPARVIAELCGVPVELRADMRRLIDPVLLATTSAEQGQASARGLYEAMQEMVHVKRRRLQEGLDAPGTDLATVLITARDDDTGARLDDRELVDSLIMLIGAGQETTVNLIGNAVVALLTHPDQLHLVRHGHVGWPQVVEETLRRQSPIAVWPLYHATRDITLPGSDGFGIRAGESVVMCFGAVGRDPALHERVGEFDVARPDPRHMAFGHGPHYCLGAPLARLEAGIALPALFGRFPELSLAVPPGELPVLPSVIACGYRRIPVRLNPPEPAVAA